MNDEDRQLLQLISNKLENKNKTFFGFKLNEFIIFVTFIFGAGLNFAAFNEVKESTKWLVGFAKNSDTFHSAAIGVTFEQGRPTNSDFNVGIKRALAKEQDVNLVTN
jgi:hypothetical protein